MTTEAINVLWFTLSLLLLLASTSGSGTGTREIVGAPHVQNQQKTKTKNNALLVFIFLLSFVVGCFRNNRCNLTTTTIMSGDGNKSVENGDNTANASISRGSGRPPQRPPPPPPTPKETIDGVPYTSPYDIDGDETRDFTEATPFFQPKLRSSSSGGFLDHCGPRKMSPSDFNGSDMPVSSSQRLKEFFGLSQTRRMLALKKEGVGSAAFLIRDALLGFDENPSDGSYDPYTHPEAPFINGVSILCRRFTSSRVVRTFLQFVIGAMVILTYFEPPLWCREYPLTQPDGSVVISNCHQVMSRWGPAANNSTLIVEWYPNTGTALLTPEQSYLIEGIGCALIWIFFLACIGQDGLDLHRFFRQGGVRTERIVQAVSLCMLTIGLSLTPITIAPHYLSPFWRLSLFISYSRPLRREVYTLLQLVRTRRRGCGFTTNVLSIRFRFFPTNIVLCCSVRSRTHHPIVLSVFLPFVSLFSVLLLLLLCPHFTPKIPEVANILVLMLLFITFYAWVGVVMFYNSAEGRMHFPNLIDAMWTLWTCVTTVIYPDVMMPAYNENRLATLYFMVFMVITMFFMMNVVLASVVNSYDNELERRRNDQERVTKRNLTKAFGLLDPNNTGKIDRDTVMALFFIINEDFPEFR